MNPIQLFDPASSTFTYVLFDLNTREALIIDPVDEQIERDLATLREYGLKLIWAVETHAHADHITSAGAYAILFYDRAVTLRLMLFVFPLKTFDVMAFWVVLFWLGADVWRTMASSGTLEGLEGVNYVSHGVGFISGALFGVIARVHGVMQRYERLPEGGTWFGYWSDALGRRVRRRPARK